MKAFSLALSFLFLALVTKPLLGAPEPLVDNNGDKVQTGNFYQIVSVIRGGGGGGLTLGTGRNGLCPLDVVQLRFDLMRGLPFLFSPINSSTIGDEQTYVYDSTNLNIIFATPQIKICNEPQVWKVDNYDQSTGQWFITTDGEVGNAGPQTLTSWFQFEKVEGNTYKIKYCPSPSICESCIALCSDVGIYFGDNARRLALSNQPFLVRIIKAENPWKERMSV